MCRLTIGGEHIEVWNGDEHALLRSADDLTLRGDKLDLARATLQFFEIDPAASGITIRLSTGVPMKAGLAGSTALLTALIGAFAAHVGMTATRYEMAETVRMVEARIMHIVCGLQDQQMTIFGGLNFMDFRDKEDLEQRATEPLAVVEPLQSHVPTPPLLLAHTGVEHHSGQVHSPPRQRWLAGDPLVRKNYARVAEIARIGKRRLIEQDWSALGALMDENHALVAELGGSGEANETLIAAARNAGAWGAKLAGAGGGGTIIALTSDPDRVGAALIAAGADRLLYPSPQPGLTVVRE